MFCLRKMKTFAFGLILSTFVHAALIAKEPQGKPWPMHVVDDSSNGADGVKLADINGDGLLDIATGWEEGGLTIVYLHPGHQKSKGKWPSVIVGKTPGVEDAVFTDLDQDGFFEVVSCCEGNERTVYIHWPPKNHQQILDSQAWHQQAIPSSVGKTKWMFAWQIQIDDKHGPDLIVGARRPDAEIGWFEIPADAHDVENYRWHTISPAGWVMSLWPCDMDSDGDLDIVATDRYGDLSACRWLENPGHGPAQKELWKSHYMDNREHEVLSMVLDDWDDDGLEDALIAVKDFKVLFLKRLDSSGKRWENKLIPADFQAGNTRAVAVADINNDGHKDLAITTWMAKDLHGVLWLEAPREGESDNWQAHQISGIEQGIKYDRIEMLDIDGDGDQDLLTCEEHEGPGSEGLGVIWYENPTVK